MESLRITTAYFDGECIWTVDDVYGGLYKMNISTMEIFCAIPADELYKYNPFVAATIFEKDGVIIVVPMQIGTRWIFYNKRTKKISYQKIIEENSHTPDVRVLKNLLYIPPLYKGEPFIIYDLQKMQLCSVIDNFCKANADFEVWKIFINKNKCYIPLRGTNYIYSFFEKTYEKIEIDMQEKIGDADGANGEFWILPQSGKYIIKTDDTGNIIEKVKIDTKREELCADHFVKIISTNTVVFLLPYSGESIYAYERSKQQFLKITKENSELINSTPYERDQIPYWGYLRTQKEIHFFPRYFKWVSIEFENFSVKQKNIFLPSNQDYRVIKEQIDLLWNDRIHYEKTENSLLLFLKCAGDSNTNTSFMKDCIGTQIYKYMENRLKTTCGRSNLLEGEKE